MDDRQHLKLCGLISELEAVAEMGGILTPLEQAQISIWRRQIACGLSDHGHNTMKIFPEGEVFCTICELVFEKGLSHEADGQTLDRFGLWPNSDTRTFKAQAGTFPATICSAVALGSQGGLSPTWVYPSGGVTSIHGKTGESFEDRLAKQDGSDYNHESSDDAQGAEMSWIGDFNNASGLEFTDISSEDWRSYTFVYPDGKPFDLVIDKPLKLHVSESGGHRLWDAQGISHYVPFGWTHLRWKARQGQPHFVK